MKVVLTYIFPNTSEAYYGQAFKFLSSYHANPAGADHETVICCNGDSPSEEQAFMFASMPGLQFYHHDNSGYDAGGFQAVARSHPADMMLFCGSNCYFRRPGWLARMIEAFKKHGDTLYGTMGNQGHMAVNVFPHVRTTSFWCSTALFNRHPLKVTQPGQRYEWEHGASGLTTWVMALNKQPWIITAQGDFPLYICDSAPGGFQNGNQENLLAGDKNSCPPYYPCE
jgi:hypothetical protein